jgi:EAL domain-containing protein (putative c-di-GMP-specific phosphodiesterase class I)/GGDEF domain-containing protein
VSQGWKSAGTLTLQSQSRFAYRELWINTQRLFAYFVLAALGAGLLGSLLLRWITQPLGAVVAQAEAIGERRFVTIEEPRTLEFNALSRAMNGLSERVKQMLSEETERLGQWHRESLQDAGTGLLARGPFLERLAALLKREDASAQGVLVILRILQLNELNRRHGRAVMDTLLARFAHELLERGRRHEGMLAGRLNGSELGIVAPGQLDPGELAADLRDALVAISRESGVASSVLAGAATRYGNHDGVPQLLQRTDQALAIVEQRAEGGVLVADPSAVMPRSSQEEIAHWSQVLESALAQERFRLGAYPVCNRQGAVLHHEAPSRLLLPDGSELHAAQFMPWAARLGHMIELDLVVLRIALRSIAQTREPLGINLSARILAEPSALKQLVEEIERAREHAALLWLEVPEEGVYGRIDGFRALCASLRPLGCRLGIEHAGPEVAHMGALYDVGLHYVKLDAALIRGIDRSPGNQAFVRGFCTIAHAIGLNAIAEGVDAEPEWRALLGLGIDGGTGRWVSARQS